LRAVITVSADYSTVSDIDPHLESNPLKWAVIISVH